MKICSEKRGIELSHSKYDYSSMHCNQIFQSIFVLIDIMITIKSFVTGPVQILLFTYLIPKVFYLL
jgi:hypothetical protein